jgi:glycosyltransferase involved in cell wall biosynthesis
MIERSRVLLLIPHLGGGGAERVFELLAQNLSHEKYELHLGLITQTCVPANPFLPGITIHALGAPRIRSASFRIISLVRRLRPQLILSGMYHLNFLVLFLRPFFLRSVRILVRQNGTVSSALEYGNTPRYTRLLYRALYCHTDKVICQSAAMASDLAHELSIKPTRLAVLPNPIDVDAIRLTMQQGLNQWTGPGPHLLAVGRLSREKGFDLLLQALHSVRQSFPTTDLTIVGAGPEDADLKSLCFDLGLESAVHFAGLVAQPVALFRGTSVFVLPSRQEGMPNALLEAAAGGLPIVTLPASGGIVDLLREQPGVWIANGISSAALSASLITALNALRPAERFAHSFIDQFRIDRAILGYEDLIDATLQVTGREGPR